MAGQGASQRIKGTRDAGATRGALLQAGLELFADRGYDGTTVDAVSLEARVNKAMIHYHFGNKLGLYRAILHETLGGAAEQLEVVRRSDRPAPDRLSLFLDIFGELHLAQPRLSAMLLGELLAGGPRLDDALLQKVLGIFGTVRSIVAQGVRTGAFREVDPLLTHLSMVLALVAFFATTPFRERLVSTFGIPGGREATGHAFIAHIKLLMERGLSREALSKES